MKLVRPAYYDTFRCTASACSDSCCQLWDVEVDPAHAALYRAVQGPTGDRLRRYLKDEEGSTWLQLDGTRCPMWRQDGLCRIQAELGEQALCSVCTQFPRLTHDYGCLVEKDLELSCPEAARLILASPAAERICQELPGGEEADCDAEALGSLQNSRERALAILTDPASSPAEALALLLFWGSEAQQELDGEEPLPWKPEASLAAAREAAQAADIPAMRDFFSELEILTEDWRSLLQQLHAPRFPEQVRALAVYFVNRRWLQAVSDLDLMSRVKFIVIACILIGSLGQDYIRTAQLFSKEIENDADNTDALLDAAWEDPIFADVRLLGALLKPSEPCADIHK